MQYIKREHFVESVGVLLVPNNLRHVRANVHRQELQLVVGVHGLGVFDDLAGHVHSQHAPEVRRQPLLQDAGCDVAGTAADVQDHLLRSPRHQLFVALQELLDVRVLRRVLVQLYVDVRVLHPMKSESILVPSEIASPFN